MITTILVGTLSLFMLMLALRIFHLSRIIDDLELRVLRAEKRLQRHATGDFGP